MLSWEGNPLVTLSSISLQALTLHMGHTHDHIHFDHFETTKDKISPDI